MFDFGLYTEVSDSGPHGPFVLECHSCKSLSQKLEILPINHAEYLRHHYSNIDDGWFVFLWGGGVVNGLLRQYFSLYWTVCQIEGEREKKG